MVSNFNVYTAKITYRDPSRFPERVIARRNIRSMDHAVNRMLEIAGQDIASIFVYDGNDKMVRSISLVNQ